MQRQAGKKREARGEAWEFTDRGRRVGSDAVTATESGRSLEKSNPESKSDALTVDGTVNSQNTKNSTPLRSTVSRRFSGVFCPMSRFCPDFDSIRTRAEVFVPSNRRQVHVPEINYSGRKFFNIHIYVHLWAQTASKPSAPSSPDRIHSETARSLSAGNLPHSVETEYEHGKMRD